MDIQLSASLASANPLCYRESVAQLDRVGLNAYHFDICDGHFAPTFLLFPGLIKHLRPLTTRRFDVHLYCTHPYPSRYLDELAAYGADVIAVHVDAAEDYVQVVRQIQQKDLKAILAILPSTTIPENIEEILPSICLLIFNTVGPAYAGQPFDPHGSEHLAQLSRIVHKNELSIEIAVDRNVSVERLETLLGAGCTPLVCGISSIFKPDIDLAEALTSFRRQVETHSSKLLQRATIHSRNKLQENNSAN